MTSSSEFPSVWVERARDKVSMIVLSLVDGG